MSKIFIIGNGFDLSMGMKTSYDQFIESEEFGTLIFHKNDLAIFIKQDFTRSGWCDLEESISKYSLSKQNGKLYREYEDLKNAIKNYLRSIELQICLDTPGVKMIEENFIPGDHLFVFNYTKTVHEIFKKLFVHDPVHYITHIHGELAGDDIVLGIDDEQGYKDSDTFFLKSHSDLFDARKITSSLDGATSIYFFGHSLGDSDRQYFKNLFLSILYNLNYPRKSLFIYCYGDRDLLRKKSAVNSLAGKRMGDLKIKCDLNFINIG